MASDKNQQVEGEVKSSVVKTLNHHCGRRTSVSLENAFRQSLKDTAKTQRKTLTSID
jgi:predicted DNA-binding ribbon-helix-helix protein